VGVCGRVYLVFEAAEERFAGGVGTGASVAELAELAVMSALVAWLRRWQPIAIHGAIFECARPEAVAGALGDSGEVAFERWREWVAIQCRGRLNLNKVSGTCPKVRHADNAATRRPNRARSATFDMPHRKLVASYKT
jgi:hypothetical protein